MISIARAQAILIAGLFLLTLPGASSAADQGRDEEIHQTVARISYISGNVSYSRGDDPDNWQAADVNVPMTLGDRVYTGESGRVELQVHGGDVIRLDTRSDLAALNLTDDTKQFSLKEGLASFKIRRLGEDEYFEVDTPNAAITFERPGDYRIEVDADGNTRVAVRQGRVVWAAGGGQVPLTAGDEMRIDGIDTPRYEVVAMSEPDRFDHWVEERERRLQRFRSSRYVSSDIVGIDDLDEHGRWQDIPEYGHVWTPVSVERGWQPYRVGHWVWQDPWGWTWIAGESWGWAPYHYGRWVVYSSRWYWVPVAPEVRFVTYSPALVAFVGGGPGWSVSVSAGGGGFVGWFPLAPRDPFVPWWGPRPAVNVNVTNVTYVNRTYVTVVNQKTFISGGVVTNNYIRDRAIMRRVVQAPVAPGPIPVLPTRASLRVAVRRNQPVPARPPAAILARPVVARVAPPPGPPAFQKKLALIRQSGGAPVGAAAAARISVADHGTARAITAVKPVTAEPGHMTLAPSHGGASVARPEPVAPVRGRSMATSAKPVASSPVTSSAPPAPAASSRPVGQAGSTREQPAQGQPKSEERVKQVERPARGGEKAAPPQASQPERPAAAPARESKPPVERPAPESKRAAPPPPQARQPERPAAPSARESKPPVERPTARSARESKPPVERPAAPSAKESKPPVERPQTAPARENRPERQVGRPPVEKPPAERAHTVAPDQKKQSKEKPKEKPTPKDEKK
jgi:hypothetical protein